MKSTQRPSGKVHILSAKTSDLPAGTSALEVRIDAPRLPPLRSNGRRDRDCGGDEMSRKALSRIKLTPIQERELFAEVEGKCPLCGDSLVAEKNGRRIRVYDAAHIYPHSPTSAQLKALKDVPVPSDIESPNNIILLCKKCHKLQDDETSAADLLRLYLVKQEKSGAYRAAQETSSIELEPELKQVVERLSNLDDTELVALSFKPLMVNRKIESIDLRRKVLNYVTTYYETLYMG